MRRAYLIKCGGDPEIAAALHGGVMDALRAWPSAGGSEAVMRVAIHRGRGSDYWQAKITEARCLYDTPEPPRLVRALLSGYGLVCWLASRAYHCQDNILRRRHT